MQSKEHSRARFWRAHPVHGTEKDKHDRLGASAQKKWIFILR